jgi:hypothetical protein
VRLVSLRDLIDSNLTMVLGYRPEFHTMVWGCLCFKFRSKEDLGAIFNRLWGWGPSDMVLKEWAINLGLWKEEVLTSIGNKIGRFLNYKT